ncbi:polysaccharide biosynthesis protein [Massilia sp. TW-1]|uniref:Polysaccharide biosynthesis protein n=1 Tax=Telluria antibiotica TaxID=2717319 RepID=A0ABX0P8S6_9BURK|nr:nucleoside-diphosphate sugar epimerase/dehydratase [Telluria antibiotica]NIA53691.1 polysaccharide biosynthesis protein [Telluria antibiotica]
MKNTFLNLSRTQKQVIAAATDIIFIPIILIIAVALDLNKAELSIFPKYSQLIIFSPALAIAIFARIGLYRAIIRYIDHKIVTTIVTGAFCCALALFLVARIVGFAAPSSVFAIFGANLVLYLLVSRFVAHGFFVGDRRSGRRTRVAIYGAGEAGVQLANALRPGSEYIPVAFIDDNPQLHHATISGVKVYAPSRLRELIDQYDISAVLLAIPSLTPAKQRTIIDKLTPLKVRIKVTPSMRNLVKGMSRVEDVREIQIEDLLSRDPVAPDDSLLSVCITGKSVAVSGAGGSIGSELCRQIVKLQPRRLVLLELSEFALYSIDQELRAYASAHDLDVELVPFMGSVVDLAKCREIFQRFEVETVYHAAAYKHVPLVEQNPIEGIRNNVFGTLNFARAAVEAKVKCFVLVSTDKAVRPTNVMGSTKRLAELILQAFSRQHGHTRFCMVRFGNVLGSSGSVVPLFRRQIEMGGPVTLTHPEITRYFMTIPEAAQLVLQAGSMGKGGDVFVLDMGEPVKIADLAKRMIHLSGQEVFSAETPDGTIEIKYVGLRPGEKLYEELLIGDNVTGTAHPLIMRAQEAEIAWPFLELMLRQLEDACDRFDHEAIRAQLRKMVSEYAPTTDIDDHLWKRGLSLEFPVDGNAGTVEVTA